MHLLAFAESIQLFPDGTLFIHVALILIMIWVLNQTFFKPINRVIQSREKNKGAYGSEAEAILADVQEKQAKYSRELLAARSQGYELIEKERTAAVEDRQSKISSAKTEVSATVAAGRQEVEQQANAARAVIEKESEVLAEKISSNILKG